MFTEYHSVKVEKELETDFIPGYHPKAFFEAYAKFKRKFGSPASVAFEPDITSQCKFTQYEKRKTDPINGCHHEHRVNLKFQVSKRGLFTCSTFGSFKSLLDFLHRHPFFGSDLKNCSVSVQESWLTESKGDLEEFTGWFSEMVETADFRDKIEMGILAGLDWNNPAYHFPGGFNFDAKDRDLVCDFLCKKLMREWFIEQGTAYLKILAVKEAELKSLKRRMTYGKGFEALCEEFNINLEELRNKKNGNAPEKGDSSFGDKLSAGQFLHKESFHKSSSLYGSLEDIEFELDEF